MSGSVGFYRWGVLRAASWPGIETETSLAFEILLCGNRSGAAWASKKASLLTGQRSFWGDCAAFQCE